MQYICWLGRQTHYENMSRLVHPGDHKMRLVQPAAQSKRTPANVFQAWCQRYKQHMFRKKSGWYSRLLKTARVHCI